ncbi:hypothetical protein GCM10009814_16010 [Lapillicoccus jejuensis]|uniref:Sec-independent protein translocase protein TatB n=1 Tax=Lapillicoccus jejuensis TaxID=402171 RepID=A0A542DW93_9MICO|nr:sec-independent protein translocase protein TatB [Lapillicoccus jejuensis]
MGIFDVNGYEFLILLVVGIVVLGPERLPEYAAKLARFVQQARGMASGARESLREQMGPEFDDIDWAQYDPRRYDPRRIVREALLEPFESGDPQDDDKPVTATMAAVAPAQVFDPSKPVPWDAEAT